MTEENNPAAVELGRLGSLNGGKVRVTMTKEERSESTLKAKAR